MECTNDLVKDKVLILRLDGFNIAFFRHCWSIVRGRA